MPRGPYACPVAVSMPRGPRCQPARTSPVARRVSAIIMSSAPGAPPMQAQSLPRLATVDDRIAVEEYIALHHNPNVAWYTTLDNHALTRPKRYGCPVVT